MTGNLTLEQLSDKIMALAGEKRWGTKIEEINVLEKFALIHSEVSEAVDAYRKGRNSGKDGLPEELADIVFRVLHLAGILGIDNLEEEILNKIETNKSRDWSDKRETFIKQA